MTKQDFIAIAAIFAARPWTKTDAETKVIIYDLADYFSLTNPRFNRSQFLDACGIGV